MGKALKAGGYILSFLLVLTYFLILGTSLYPRVVLEYDLYYLKGDLQDWPGYGGLDYTLGKQESFARYDDNRIKRRGNMWNSFEEDGCWTYGDTASLLYTGIEKQRLEVRLFVPEVRQGASAQVNVNGVKIGDIEAAQIYCFEIPPELTENEVMKLEFKVSNFGPVGEDARNQGIKLKEISIDAAFTEN